MKSGLFCVVFLFGSVLAQARDLNYIEAHLFRLAEYEKPGEWINPFSSFEKINYKYVKFSIFGSLNRTVPEVISDIGSKNKNTVSNRLGQIFGQPLDLSAKILLSLRYKKIITTISENASAVAIVNDPVFPELEELILHGYTLTNSILMNIDKKWTVIPRLSIGSRQVLDLSLTAIELSTTKADQDIRNEELIFFATATIKSLYKSELFSYLFEINSFPVHKNKFLYWNSRVGIKSPNLLTSSASTAGKSVRPYAYVSPYHAGDYGLLSTFKVGADMQLSNAIGLDFFVQGKALFGASLNVKYRYFDFSLVSFERSFDSNFTQLSRQYGIMIATKI